MTARAFFMKSDRKKDADMGKNSLKIKMAGLAGSLMLTAVLFSRFWGGHLVRFWGRSRKKHP